MTTFQIIFLVLIGILLLFAVVRWSRTPETHPDYMAYGDMMRLLGLMLVGQLVLMGRERFLQNVAVFWLCNLLLLPLVAFALFLSWRLICAYRAGT